MIYLPDCIFADVLPINCYIYMMTYARDKLRFVLSGVKRCLPLYIGFQFNLKTDEIITDD